MALSFEGLARRGVRLGGHSSYSIGGKADYFACPSSLDELFFLIDYSRKYSVPFTIIGLGANVLFPDRPEKGRLFVSMKNLLEMRPDGDMIFFTAGVPLSFLAICGMLAGMEDLCFTYLLPGTVGAGVYMNARYGEKEISQAVSSVAYTDLDERSFSVRSIPSSECSFGYKTSLFQGKNRLILGARFEIPGLERSVSGIRMNFEMIKRNARRLSGLKNFYSVFHKLASGLDWRGTSFFKDIETDRNNKRHFDYPSCGSVFKNNRAFGAPTGTIIDRLGLKGMSHGGAMVSPHHGNVIINYRNASAADVLYLIDYASDMVYKEHGIRPENEVVIL